MFVTYDLEGKVTAYSDNARNFYDLKEGERQVEIDKPFNYISCKEGMLRFKEGVLYNGEDELGKEVVRKAKPVPVER